MTLLIKISHPTDLTEIKKHRFSQKIKDAIKTQGGQVNLGYEFKFQISETDVTKLIISGTDAWHPLSALISLLPNDKKLQSEEEESTIINLNHDDLQQLGLEEFIPGKLVEHKQLNKAANTKNVAPLTVILHSAIQKPIYRLNNSRMPVVLSTAALATITMTFSILSIVAHYGCIAAAIPVAPYLFASVAAIGVAALLGFFIYYTVTKALQIYEAKTAQSKNNRSIFNCSSNKNEDTCARYYSRDDTVVLEKRS